MTSDQRVKALAARIAKQVQSAAGKGVEAAAVFLAARLRECVSVPAPKKRVVSRSGDIRYTATVKATPGAPPRMVSGALRRGITHAVKLPPGNHQHQSGMKVVTVGVMARSKRGFNYPKHLETRTSHKFIAPTIHRYRAEIRKIVGAAVKVRGIA